MISVSHLHKLLDSLDINNLEIKITLHEPAPEEIVNAEVVELMGHMHGGNFTAASITILK
mgnify:CR=1 FL=1